jgi:hypothetical protein
MFTISNHGNAAGAWTFEVRGVQWRLMDSSLDMCHPLRKTNTEVLGTCASEQTSDPHLYQTASCPSCIHGAPTSLRLHFLSSSHHRVSTLGSTVNL